MLASYIRRHRELSAQIVAHISTGDVRDAYPLIPERNRLESTIRAMRDDNNRHRLTVGDPDAAGIW